MYLFKQILLQKKKEREIYTCEKTKMEKVSNIRKYKKRWEL